jgi:hypothetical protein
MSHESYTSLGHKMRFCYNFNKTDFRKSQRAFENFREQARSYQKRILCPLTV